MIVSMGKEHKDSKNKLGFCALCKQKGKEVSAVAIIGKIHLCGLHIAKDALINYAANHLKIKQEKLKQEFALEVLGKVKDEVIYHIDEQAKEEFGIL